MDGGDLLAKDASGPSGYTQPSSREVLDLWGRTDPNVRYEDLVVRLLSGGIPPEEAQNLILVQQYPETLEAFVQPGDAMQADALARLAEYPFRPGVYSHLDPEERVSYVESVHREWVKSLQTPEPTPAPTLPAGPTTEAKNAAVADAVAIRQPMQPPALPMSTIGG